jgi:hypothetical protein
MAPEEQPANPARLCVYCGVRPSTRRGDHIPPSCLFAVRPDPPIIIPSCEDCNRGRSKEDEYFRLTITSRADVADHPEAPTLSEAVVRGLARPQARGFLQAVCQNIGLAELRSPNGLYLEDVGVMNVDLRRLDAVAARIVRGLFYHEAGMPLAPASVVEVAQESGLRGISAAEREQLVQLLGVLLAQPEHKIGNDVFSYWYLWEGRGEVSLWLLRFYQRVWFMGVTRPAEPDAA